MEVVRLYLWDEGRVKIRQPFRRSGVLVLVMILLSASLSLLSGLKAATPVQVYLPIARTQEWPSPFGFQMAGWNLRSTEVAARAQELGARWVRIDGADWLNVQPEQGATYNWTVLVGLETELRVAAQLGLTPIVVIKRSPPWATLNVPYETSCGAVREDRFQDFAAFLQALVVRYSAPPFNVHHWELGNEPDVDPRLLGPNAQFGCWGNQDDPYYGGEHYGRMLAAVTPRIKAADPGANVIIGGLLLASPNTSTLAVGRPESFLEGILRSGAAPYFDGVGFHAHTSYDGKAIDYSGITHVIWGTRGGVIVGKAVFLREVMVRYNVVRPLYLTELALGCPEYFRSQCPTSMNESATPAFDQAQADFLPRAMARAAAAELEAITWYSLDFSNWRHTFMLDASSKPRPVYGSYQQFIRETMPVIRVPVIVDYGAEVEAFRFDKGNSIVDLVWSTGMNVTTLSVPANEFTRAVTRDGNTLPPEYVDGMARLQVGFSPLYIHRRQTSTN